MDLYWTCSDCGSSNPYPSAKTCECCGKEISTREAETAKKTVAEIEKQKKENEEKRKREEAARIAAEKRKKEEEYKQRQLEAKRLEEERRQKEKALKQKAAAEKRKKRLNAWLSIVKKISQYGTKRVVGVLCAICVLVCAALIGVSVINNDTLYTKLDVLQENVESYFINFLDVQCETFTYSSEEMITDEEYSDESGDEDTNGDEYSDEENVEPDEQEIYDENETADESETENEYYYVFRPRLKINNMIEKAVTDIRESEGIYKLKEFLRW